MRLLITGGCGFIGTNLVDYLLASGGYEIRILDTLSLGSENLGEVARKHCCAVTHIHPAAAPEPYPAANVIQLVRGDVRDMSACEFAAAGADCIIHLAAHTGVMPSVKDPLFDFDVNARGTVNLLQAANRSGVTRFIMASSNAPLGNQDLPLHEGKVPKPLSPYGASKLAGEAYCSAFHECYGIETLVFRFSNVYGPYSLHKNSVVARFLKDAAIAQRLTVYGQGTQTRDFLHVADICRVFCRVLQLDNANDGVWGHTYHLGTGRETEIIALAKRISSLFDTDITIEFLPERRGEIVRNYSDVSKAARMLGFTPAIGIDEGLAQVHGWFAQRSASEIAASKTVSGSE